MQPSAEITSKGLKQRLWASWEHRRSYVQTHQLEAFRLVHGVGDQLSGLSIDVYAGSFLIAAADPFWLSQQKELEELLTKLECQKPQRHPSFHWVDCSRGQTTNLLHPTVIETKTVTEAGLHFEVRLGQGLHSGLFLDQRENRQRLLKQSSGKRVLNLFCYTGSLSVAALKGGADEVVSVDLSKNYLRWLARNLEINGLQNPRAVAHAQETAVFLARSYKQKERYDLILLDPPTFSRHKGMASSTSQNLLSWIKGAQNLLGNRGEMFVSINTRKIHPRDFRQNMKDWLYPLKPRFFLPGLPPDFRLAEQERQNPPLKYCWARAENGALKSPP